VRASESLAAAERVRPFLRVVGGARARCRGLSTRTKQAKRRRHRRRLRAMQHELMGRTWAGLRGRRVGGLS